MKRRRSREQDEATAREQAEERREALLAELKARLGASPQPEPPPAPQAEPEPQAEPDPQPEPDPQAEPADTPNGGDAKAET